jgi:hypothetical protein
MLAKLVTGAGAIALALFLAWMYGNARYDAGKLAERDAWHVASIDAERQRGDERIADYARGAAAVGHYADQVGALAASALKSQMTVRDYAQTAAGRVQCLSADRVLGIDADAAGLGFFTPSTAPGRDGTLHADADRAQP